MMKTEETRDLYKRDIRLRYCIDRVKHGKIPEDDREDILKFIEFMQREEKLWIIRCITLLLNIKEQIRKEFRAFLVGKLKVKPYKFELNILYK